MSLWRQNLRSRTFPGRAAVLMMCWTGPVFVAAILLVSVSKADLLFDNGPVTDADASGSCDQGPAGCGGSGRWTYYDNFNLGAPSVVTAFDYVDWFTSVSGDASVYVETNWSFRNSDPFAGGAPFRSGTSTATLAATGVAKQYRFSIIGLSELFPTGEYWLGINNTVLNDARTTVATVDRTFPNAKSSDGVTFFLNNKADRAFRVFGSAVPEPTTTMLAVIVMFSLGCYDCRSQVRK